MAVINTEAVRAVAKQLAAEMPDQDWPFTRDDLKIRLKTANSEDNRALKSIFNRLIQRGEIVYAPDGRWCRYVPEAAPAATADECWARVYRAARVAKGPFPIAHIVKVAVLSQTQARDTLESLRESGYLEGFRQDDVVYYRATDLMRKTPEVSLEPRREKSQFSRARMALAEVNKIFLTLDVNDSAVQERIRTQLFILTEAFEKGEERDS
jgi:hypothetical protein